MTSKTPPPRPPRPPRVVVIDDSAVSRAAIAEVLEEGGCEVVGRAMDGGMALRMVLELEPDVVTCDLEMPRMDGFTFLRVLLQKKAVPVVVVTSDSRPEAALMALDLGARDFVVKPGARPSSLRALGPSLVAKVHALAAERARRVQWGPLPEVPPMSPRRLVVVGASTGGPSALRDVLSQLSAAAFPPILIAQHMPERFTTAFAERLRRFTGVDVREAEDDERLEPGQVRVAPGGRHLEVHERLGQLVSRVVLPEESDRYVPSVDRLFETAAEACGAALLGVVLTGMGRDGAHGAAILAQVGAPLWTESRATAVIDGMPTAAADAHKTATSLPLDEMAGLFGRALCP